MKKSLTEALRTRLYLDGGTGTKLVAMGVSTAHGELLNIRRPELIASIHEAYFRAGSNAVCTNTFSCNRKKADLSEYALSQIVAAAVENARRVADAYDGYVLYDCGPTGELLYPYGRTTFDEAYELFAEQARIVKDLPVDGVLIETVSDLQEMRAAILAFKENADLPVLCSMTFEKGGRTFAGTKADAFAICAENLGVQAVGVNCGVGAKDMKETAAILLENTSLPVFVKPNAGMPRYEGGVTTYDVRAEDFAKEMREIALLGVGVLGGCCGTDESYIDLTVRATRDLPVKRGRARDAVCSYSRVAEFGKNTLVVGERVNPTNKPLLKRAILEDDYDYILSMCVEQAEQGADMLDVNLGMAGIDEGKKLVGAISYVQGVADLPLMVDTAKKDALEKAVRVTCGTCVINSVSGEEKTMERVFPVAKKYGSYVVALCLDENGIPEDAEGRIRIARRIVRGAEAYGIDKGKLLFDPLTMAVSVDVRNALIVLETIGRLQKELGVKTTLGLSNVSFGLPNRAKINATFYDMIVGAGVTAAIVNPSLRPVVDEGAKRLLLGRDEGCALYVAENAAQEKREEAVPVKDVRYCIVKGLGEEALRAVREKATKENYDKVIDEDVIGGLNELGDRYEKGQAFLPQLIAGSEAAKLALDYLKATFMAETQAAKATVVLATVKGDVHDIGKNIVKAVTANYGYRIVDLGKDVPTETVLAAVEEYAPQAVGLSALMTTTIDNMTDTVRALKARYPELPVIVGGAVVTAGYADSVGAIYSKDARQNVKILEKLFPNR